MSGWETRRVNGKNYNWFHQDFSADCGLACILMVMNLKRRDHAKLQESFLQQHRMGGFEGSRVRYISERPGSVPLPIAQQGVGQGLTIDHISTILKENQFKIEEIRGDNILMQNARKNATHDKPVIAMVQWDRDGNHWIVIHHYQRAGIFSHQPEGFIVLDPYHGPVFSPGKISYTSSGGQTANFLDWGIRITHSAI